MKKIDAEELAGQRIFPHRGPVDAHHRRHGGAVQHHDRQLGRPGRDLWGAPAATCYMRPQRYTKEFVDREEYFTLAFFGEEYRKALTLCGSKSGREVDKVKECGFTVAPGPSAAPPILRRRSWCWCAASAMSRRWTPPAIPQDAKEQMVS